MTPKHLALFLPAALLFANPQAALAGKTIEEAGVLVCVNDKWDEKELDKGHKLVDFAGRCGNVPDDATAEKYSEECVGKYEYMPDGSWKGSGSCKLKFKDGEMSDTWEEGSHVKEYTYVYTGGTGKFAGAKGGGTYSYENITDTIAGGRFKGKIELP